MQDGSTLHLVGSVLNHKDPKTTAGYAYFQTQQREQALTRHGQQVLSFLPSLPDTQAPACYEVQPTAELPPADAPIPARRAHYLERDVLYRLVWEAPVSEVAQRLGISDVGLAKVCRRAAIPLPARGYWAKVAAGSDLGPPNLPPAPAGLPRMIRIKGHKARNANVETAATTMEPNRPHDGGGKPPGLVRPRGRRGAPAAEPGRARCLPRGRGENTKRTALHDRRPGALNRAGVVGIRYSFDHGSVWCPSS